MKILSRVLDVNKREVDRLQKIVTKINDFSPAIEKLSQKAFVAKAQELKKRATDGEDLQSLLPEAFAVAKEASYRAIGLKHHDVQLMAAIALFEGKVVEQKTGEGKTLSAVPALYLRALSGKGVHLVTVNDYLARLGAGWNAPTFELLGLSVGVIVQETKSFIYDISYSDTSHGDERLSHLKPSSRKEAYDRDITYGTNNEFGFDYLRDNMVSSLSEMVQRGHYFAIVDEVDSVLIDEARTPLIISAPDTEPTQKYYEFAKLVEKLNPDTDYTVDEKSRSCSLTEHGITKVEKILGVENLYEKDFETVHHIENALKAKTLFLIDQQYVVKDNQVIIVDEFTGRLMNGRRWSDGIHQAVEAKEGVAIQQESKTLATISFQNYFRMYTHLSGMTGTAVTEAEEFRKIYNLDVVAIPTHAPMIRKDHGDLVYKTVAAKYSALIEDVNERRAKGQPVLIGTTSIDKNEIIGDLLKRKKIPHNILNAKNHEREAMIIADAGKSGAVTVATNMAGRGVDIVLGGAKPDRPDGMSEKDILESKEYKEWKKNHDIVIKAGGLHVVGTERHESRRIDNQLRGRAGRQGDPGSSRFYLSLEDDLMRVFGGEQIAGIMGRLKIPEDQPIENALVSRAIAQAQTKVEGFHFDTRKQLVEYDDVANQQREVIYKLRARILGADDVKEELVRKLEQQLDRIILQSWPEFEEHADFDRVVVGLTDIIPFDDASRRQIHQQLSKITDKEKLKAAMREILTKAYESREKQLGAPLMRQVEKHAYISSLDHLWIDHIDRIDSFRESVRLRAYGQRDPLVEFKNEAYEMFESLVDRIDEEICHRIFRLQVSSPVTEIPLAQAVTNVDPTDAMGLTDEPAKKKTGKTPSAKLGRNDPCWCGKLDAAGKPVKWKKCHYPTLPTI